MASPYFRSLSTLALVSVCGLLILAAAGCGSSGSPSTSSSSRSTEPPGSGPSGTPNAVGGVEFDAAPPGVLSACRSTASKVGYAVPCPTLLPLGTRSFGSVPTCHVPVIGTACSGGWPGWVVGSSVSPAGHLVITASPRVIRDPAKLLNGPGWYHGAAERRLGSPILSGRKRWVYFVPPATNDGSSFAGHIVVLWSQDGHSYAVGFHDLRGVKITEQLNALLVSGIRMVAPGT